LQRGGRAADRVAQMVEDAPAQSIGGQPGAAVFAAVGGLGDVGHWRSVAAIGVFAVNGRPHTGDAAGHDVCMRREVSTADELREIVGHPNEYVANKVKPRLAPVQRDWIANSPLCFVATTDADGRVDVSPKGDPPGFVHIIDDTVLQRPHVGTLFVIPGRGDTLRINGTARVLADADYFDTMTVKGKRPILALEIAIEEVFFHCAKAFLRADAWEPSTWNPTAVPSVAQMAKAVLKTDVDQDELEKYYSEAHTRTLLY
jgi:predicted pyridoxine 5'-phosphate oxidase superfamily flavin-nucleotide-binding protein